MGDSSLNLLLENVVWVIVGMDVVGQVSAALPIPPAMTNTQYAACQSLQASITKDYNYASLAPSLCCT